MSLGNNNIEINNMEYKIFEVNNYSNTFFDKKQEKWSVPMIKAKIDTILTELKNNKGYHLRLNKDDKVILFGDLDYLESPDQFNEIMTDLGIFIGMKDFINKISFTESIKIDINKYSYHWCIKDYYCDMTYLKDIMISFKKKYVEKYDKNIIDTSIYSDKWFRLPDQTNSTKLYSHLIKKGELKDFIVQYIPKESKLIKSAYGNDEDEDEEEEEEKEEEDDEEEQEEEEEEEEEEENDVQENNINNNHNLFFNDEKNKKSFIISLLDILDSKYYNNFEEWIKIGFIIKNELNDYDVFKNFSKKSKKYNKLDNIKQWKTFNNKNDSSILTLRSLMTYCKISDVSKYNNIIGKFIRKNYFEVDDYDTTGSLSDFFNEIINTFIYNNKVLYFFNGVYWNVDVNNTILHNYLDSKFKIILLNQSNTYDSKKMSNTKATQSERDEHLNKMIKIRKMINNIRSVIYRENLIKDIIHKITNNDIIFDNNNDLFSFKNKIYDLQNGCFIDPLPSHYISITTNYNYDEQYDNKNKKKELKNILKTILPDDEIRDYYFTLLSTSLDGYNNETITIMNGEGRNGKGVVSELMMKMVGGYGYTLPIHILTDKSKSGASANVDLALLNNKRFVVSREPEIDKMLQCGIIKELTGGNIVKARQIYSSNNDVNLRLSLFLECNDKPLLNSAGFSIEERIKDVLFPCKAMDEYQYNLLTESEKVNVMIKNSYYKTDLFKDEYKQALFLILIDYYNIYIQKNKKIVTPDAILLRNQEYIKRSDELVNWFESRYIKNENEENKIKMKIIYKSFMVSDYFQNLTKENKRKNNYKNFIEKMMKNSFLKKYVIYDSHETYYLIQHSEIKDDDSDSEDEDEDL